MLHRYSETLITMCWENADHDQLLEVCMCWASLKALLKPGFWLHISARCFIWFHVLICFQWKQVEIMWQSTHMFSVKASDSYLKGHMLLCLMLICHMLICHMLTCLMLIMPLLKATVIHMCHSRWCLAKRNPGPSQNKTNTWLNQTLFDTAPLPLASWLPHGHELMWAWHVGCPVWTCLFVLLLFCSDGACADHLLKNCLVLHLFNCTCGNVTLQLRTASLAPTVELALVK